MKRLLIILLLLLLLVSPLNAQMLQGCMSAGGAAAGPVYTDCSNVGTSVFYWTGEHTSGSGYACFGSTATNRSAITAEIVASGTDPGVASPESAGNVLHADAAEYAAWAISGCSSGDCNIVNTNLGYFEADVYLGSSAADSQIFKVQYNSSNSLYLTITSTNTLSANHVGANSVAGIASSATISDSTWTKVKFGWSVAANKLGVKIGSGAWATACPSGCTTTTNTVTAFQGDPTIFRVPNTSNTEAIYLDNVRIYESAPADW